MGKGAAIAPLKPKRKEPVPPPDESATVRQRPNEQVSDQLSRDQTETPAASRAETPEEPAQATTESAPVDTDDQVLEKSKQAQPTHNEPNESERTHDSAGPAAASVVAETEPLVALEPEKPETVSPQPEPAATAPPPPQLTFQTQAPESVITTEPRPATDKTQAETASDEAVEVAVEVQSPRTAPEGVTSTKVPSPASAESETMPEQDDSAPDRSADATTTESPNTGVESPVAHNPIAESSNAEGPSAEGSAIGGSAAKSAVVKDSAAELSNAGTSGESATEATNTADGRSAAESAAADNGEEAPDEKGTSDRDGAAETSAIGNSVTENSAAEEGSLNDNASESDAHTGNAPNDAAVSPSDSSTSRPDGNADFVDADDIVTSVLAEEPKFTPWDAPIEDVTPEPVAAAASSPEPIAGEEQTPPAVMNEPNLPPQDDNAPSTERMRPSAKAKAAEEARRVAERAKKSIVSTPDISIFGDDGQRDPNEDRAQFFPKTVEKRAESTRPMAGRAHVQNFMSPPNDLPRPSAGSGRVYGAGSTAEQGPDEELAL